MGVSSTVSYVQMLPLSGCVRPMVDELIMGIAIEDAISLAAYRIKGGAIRYALHMKVRCMMRQMIAGLRAS